MLTCDQCGTRMPQLPVRIEIVRETGPIGLPNSPAHGETVNFTQAVSVLLVATTCTRGRARAG